MLFTNSYICRADLYHPPPPSTISVLIKIRSAGPIKLAENALAFLFRTQYAFQPHKDHVTRVKAIQNDIAGPCPVSTTFYGSYWLRWTICSMTAWSMSEHPPLSFLDQTLMWIARRTFSFSSHYLHTGKWPCAIRVHLTGKENAFLNYNLTSSKRVCIAHAEYQNKTVLGWVKVDTQSARREVTSASCTHR